MIQTIADDVSLVSWCLLPPALTYLAITTRDLLRDLRERRDDKRG